MLPTSPPQTHHRRLGHRGAAYSQAFLLATFEHVSMHHENWLQFAESQMKTSMEDVICHIQQFKNRHDSLVFVLVDSSAILPATSAASAVGRDKLLEDWWKPLNESAYV